MIDPTIRAADEAYATARDLLLADDLPEYDAHVPGWRALVRLGAVSFDRLEGVRRAARIAAVRKAREDATALGSGVPWQQLLPPDGVDPLTYDLGLVRFGLRVPSLSEAQAADLGARSPYVVRELARTIEMLSVASPDAVAAAIHALMAGQGDDAGE